MDRPTGAATLSLLFLLIVAARSSEAESSVQNRVAGQSEDDAIPQSDTNTTHGTNGSLTDVIFEEVGPEVGPGSKQQERKQESTAAGVVWDGEYEEYEEEYVDELKSVVAESHEAMSKDETKNPNVTSPVSPSVADRSTSAKSFESHEVTVADDSDEDVGSNEAITTEVVEKNDDEVADLLRYIKWKGVYAAGKTKAKRVPTVKKELSTQKEILIGSNETQLPKSLTPPKDTANRLNEEAEPVKRRNAEKDQPTGLERVEAGSYPEGASGGVRRKPDKRQETVLKDVKTYLLAEYAAEEEEEEEEERKKLRELGAQEEDALVEYLLKFLVKLAKSPGRWERLHELLVRMENDPALTRGTLEPSKRGYDTTPGSLSTTVPSAGARRSRKKPKKKKKKPRQERTSSTTMRPVPVTPPLLTTTEIPWQTTPVQWRLVAERLFGPPWQEEPQEEPREDLEKGPKVRYSVAAKPRTVPSIRELIDQNKPKAGTKTFNGERKTSMADSVREMNGQRLLRFGKVNTHQPSHGQGHREFTGVYDRAAEPDRLQEYEVPEAYPRLRYNQLAPGSREYHQQRQDEDYQEDFGLQAENFAHSQEYRPPNREYAIGKGWPDISYSYPWPWKPEDRSMLPIQGGKWQWRQAQSDANYWPQRSKFWQPERTYWPSTGNEDELDDRSPKHNWSRDRQSGGWSMEKPLKVKPYDRDQPGGSWEKSSKYQPESNRSSTREDSKEKTVLPQITMRTWNSLTSDPATWPYKLPGAKPWPKDENGKSYNPNAELVKKLGLDKQTERPYEGEPSRENPKLEEPSAKQRTFDDKSELSDYKGRSRSNGSVKSWSTILSERKATKDWKPRDAEEPQNDDETVWGGKYEGTKNTWHGKDGLPKIQSVGAWVMPADQSTWKPYQIKPLDNVGEDTSGRWSGKTSGMSRSWPEKVGEQRGWVEGPTSVADWGKKANEGRSWTEKSRKWFSKTSENDAWRKKIKGDPSWLTKPSESSGSAWPSKIVDNNSWAVKAKNGASWSTKANESGSWRSDVNDDAGKYVNPEPWQAKSSNDASSWSRKSSEQTPWTSKAGELGSWQQKITDEWNYGKNPGPAGTLPSKWKQFAYHRVTAMPISKPGTTADAASSAKSKNAFVAVFAAVSSPKYAANEWRKSEEERASGGQPQVGLERPIYAWNNGQPKGNGTDPLENQLEALRQADFWPYKENEAEKEPTDSARTTANLTTVATDRHREINGQKSEKTHQRTIPMK